MRLLLSSQQGAPDNPRVWSGTPSRLLSALQRDGRLQPVPHSSVLQGPADRWARRVDRVLGAAHTSIHGPARRWLAGRRLVRVSRELACAAQLHLGTYDVPLAGGDTPRYLYVDSSYDYWVRHALSARKLNRFQASLFRSLEQRALGRVEHIFTVGRHIADSFADAFGIARDRITAVGSGLGDISPYHGPKNYGNGRLLVVAKVRPADKGLPLLLEALDLARQTRPELSLTVIGGARYPELQGREGVRGTGWISAEELQDLFNQATLYVMPATYEPWGLSYLEALACRTPVLGLRKNALPEITANGAFGFMLDDPSPAALARLLLDALADTERLRAMGEAGQIHCLAQYDWDKIASRMADRICKDGNHG